MLCFCNVISSSIVLHAFLTRFFCVIWVCSPQPLRSRSSNGLREDGSRAGKGYLAAVVSGETLASGVPGHPVDALDQDRQAPVLRDGIGLRFR